MILDIARRVLDFCPITQETKAELDRKKLPFQRCEGSDTSQELVLTPDSDTFVELFKVGHYWKDPLFYRVEGRVGDNPVIRFQTGFEGTSYLKEVPRWMVKEEAESNKFVLRQCVSVREGMFILYASKDHFDGIQPGFYWAVKGDVKRSAFHMKALSIENSLAIDAPTKTLYDGIQESPSCIVYRYSNKFLEPYLANRLPKTVGKWPGGLTTPIP